MLPLPSARVELLMKSSSSSTKYRLTYSKNEGNFVLFKNRNCGVELDLLGLARLTDMENLQYVNEDGTTEESILSIEDVIDSLPEDGEVRIVELNSERIFTARNLSIASEGIASHLPLDGRFFVSPFYNK